MVKTVSQIFLIKKYNSINKLDNIFLRTGKCMEIHSISIMIIVYFYELITQDVANICMHNSVGNRQCFSDLTDDLLTAAHYDFREFTSALCTSLRRYYTLVDKRILLVPMLYTRKT